MGSRKLERMAGLVLVLLLVAVVPAGCDQSQELVNRVWILESFGPVGAENAVVPGTEVTISFSETGVGGFTGCNRYFGDCEIGPFNFLSIGAISCTYKKCANDVSEQEEQYLSVLRNTFAYTIDQNRLRIFSTYEWSVLNFVAQ